MKIHIRRGIMLCAIAITTALFSVEGYAEMGTPIMSVATATAEQAKAWAAERNSTEDFVLLADLFWEVGELVGVNPVAAYCQSAKETAYGRFTGVVDESFFNPCGLKTMDGVRDDKLSHQRFSSWTEGIHAQMDHLALYAGAEGYPLDSTPDPRHFSYIVGRSKTVEELGGYWAPSQTYGVEIVSMMNALEQTNEPERIVAVQYMGNITALRDWSKRMSDIISLISE